MPNDFPFADTMAARMLADGLKRAMARTGSSLRQLGKQLGYKQSVVLSHMQSGRVPVPIDRAAQLAEQLEINVPLFLRAVLEQRHPEVNWKLLSCGPTARSKRSELVEVLETIARKPMDDFTLEQKKVMREVAADTQPARRWLTVHEVGAIEMLRRLVPDLATNGLPTADANGIEALLGNVRVDQHA